MKPSPSQLVAIRKDNWNADGPIVVWSDYGTEGWSPRSYPTVAAALEAGNSPGFVLTQRLPIASIVTEPDAVKQCQRCGSPLIGLRADAVFCSGRCKTAYHRAHATAGSTGETK